MISIKITCCSCFIEKKSQFDSVKSNFELFVKEKREHHALNGLMFFTEYIMVCLDCFTFQMWNLSIDDIRVFDTIACRFTYIDPTNNNFEDDIFVGNNRFLGECDLLSRSERYKIFKHSVNIGDHFFRQPKHKSCFTSMQKYTLDFFCTECKSIYCKFFEKDLHCFYF